MPYCSACGSKLETGEFFCANCGKSQQESVTHFASRRPTQRTQIKWLFGVLGVVALAFIIVIVILLASPGIYGRYYAEYEGDKIIMVIEREGTLTLSVAGESVGGTWRIEDNAILLMVEGESMYRGRIDGNSIEVYDPETGEKVLAFTRQPEMPRQADQREVGIGEIVVPAGFTEQLYMGNVASYAGQGTIEDALRSFGAAFRAAGWTRCETTTAMMELAVPGSIGFKRGNEIATVSAMRVEGQVTVSIGVGQDIDQIWGH